MNLANRIERLEEKLKPQIDVTLFVGWIDCQWTNSSGITRGVNESRYDFLMRVQEAIGKKVIWCE